MALTDLHSTGTVPSSARFVRSSPRSAIPYDALALLSALRGETGQDLRLLQVLACSPQACLILMLAGAVALVWASAGPSDATLKSEFGWTLCVLIGIAAVTLNYIRGFARSLRRTPLHQAVRNLRLLLLYTGAAWGMGAFLAMPDLPAPALVACFAAGPSLALTLLLNDAKGAAAFTLPVTLASAGAAVLGAWPSAVWVAGLLLIAGPLICCLPVLQNMIHWRRNALPEAAPH
jgi:hypothetical protein